MKPAIDAHAHLRTSIAPIEVESLRDGFVMAVTRSPGEWSSSLRRHDRRIAWGLGCHPSEPESMAAFDPSKLNSVISRASFLGEVGLDARSRVPSDIQERVLRRILHAASAEGVIVSVHSAGRAERVLELIEEANVRSVILHWWGGDGPETTRAVSLGCYFSVNVRMRPQLIASLPRERVLTETDFPATSAGDSSVTKPGAVASIERRLAELWSLTIEEIRETEWSALRALDAATGRLARASGVPQT